MPNAAKQALDHYWVRNIFKTISYEDFKILFGQIIIGEDLLNLSDTHQLVLCNEKLCILLIKKIISFDVYKKLRGDDENDDHLLSLTNDKLCESLLAGDVTQEDFIKFTPTHLDIFTDVDNNPTIYTLLENKKITGQQIANLSEELIYLLEDKNVRILFNEDKIKFAQFKDLDLEKFKNHRDALYNHEIITKLLTAKITFANYLELDENKLPKQGIAQISPPLLTRTLKKINLINSASNSSRSDSDDSIKELEKIKAKFKKN